MCPHHGCGLCFSTLKQLLDHFQGFHGEMTNKTLWETVGVPVRCPTLVFPEPAYVRDPEDDEWLSQPPQWLDMSHTDDQFEVEQLRVGTFVCSWHIGAVTLQLDSVARALSFTFIAADPQHYDQRNIRIPLDGLEDVLVLGFGCDLVELVLRARLCRFFSAGRLFDFTAGASSRGVALIALRMTQPLGRDFMARLGELVHFVPPLLALPEHPTYHPRVDVLVAFTAAVRKALAKRDAEQRGYTEEWLSAPSLSLRELLSVRLPNPQESATFKSSTAASLVAPQLNNHVLDGRGTNPIQRWERRKAEALATVAGPTPPTFSSRVPPPAADAAPDAPDAVPEAMPLRPPVRPLPPVRQPKAKTGYQLYHQARVAKLKTYYPGIKHQDAFRRAARDWSALTEAQRMEWCDLAEIKPRQAKRLAELREERAEASKEQRVEPEDQGPSDDLAPTSTTL